MTIPETIKYIIRLKNKEVRTDSKKFKAYLNDLSPECVKELKLLNRALGDNILSIIFSSEKDSTIISKLTKEFKNMGMPEKQMNFILKSFGEVLNWNSALSNNQKEEKQQIKQENKKEENISSQKTKTKTMQPETSKKEISKYDVQNNKKFYRGEIIEEGDNTFSLEKVNNKAKKQEKTIDFEKIGESIDNYVNGVIKQATDLSNKIINKTKADNNSILALEKSKNKNTYDIIDPKNEEYIHRNLQKTDNGYKESAMYHKKTAKEDHYNTPFGTEYHYESQEVFIGVSQEVVTQQNPININEYLNQEIKNREAITNRELKSKEAKNRETITDRKFETQEAKAHNTKNVPDDNLQELLDLGYQYYNDKEYTKAIKYLQKASELGNSKAQNTLGYMFLKGLGTEKDYKLALKWLQKSADNKNPKAQFTLGNMYLEGIGIKQDKKEAIKWYRMSAQGGYLEAQKALDKIFQK